MKEVPLSKGLTAIVDDADYERVMQFKWHSSLESGGKKIYVKRHKRLSEAWRWKASTIRLHHFILDMTPDELPEFHVVDHKNNNPLDNRRENLEIVTRTENMMRSEGWKRRGRGKRVNRDLNRKLRANVL